MPLDAAWPTTGKLRYELKKAWRDGTRFVVFEPHELLARVCAMIPPPRFHMIRFHGVLAPNAALRRHVVASLCPSALAMEPAPATLKTPGIEQPSLFGQMEAPSGFDAGEMRRKPWAWLLRHVVAIDVTVCPECSGKMRWRAVALTPETIAEGLARAGLSARGPRAGSGSPRGVEGHG
ncbi:transposase [Polyangium sp. 15x6]|uniref:transposase n=1 Tax=Polyangium sp. 15x6 TaxID=3042687 RepID=UPI00249B873A|nr:transposase [Polyangium sp. 15x6]MDI3290758.1 transposase [Polyangium sp. 15x6]